MISQNMQISFKKPSHWNKPYIHYWNDWRSTTWPGISMNEVSESEYVFRLDDFELYKNFVISDGQNQTEDFYCDKDCWCDGYELWTSDPKLDDYFEYSNGFQKAVIMSFDDGVVQDERLVDIFNRYGIKGTFHINSGLLNDPLKIPLNRLNDVYDGHEISCHSLTHPFLDQASRSTLETEILKDIENIERIMCKRPLGLSYPFGSYNAELLKLLPQWNLIYGRVVPQTGKFGLPGDLLRWRGTCHHRGLEQHLERFLEDTKAQLLMVWGHSWEFDSNDQNSNWTYIEKICQRLENQKVWFTTMGEFAQRLLEYRNSLK